MSGTVSPLAIICMVLACISGFAIPIVLFIYLRKKKHADTFAFVTGCVVMLVFAFMLESTALQLIQTTPLGDTIINNIWVYALYGGLMAGLFEETGRYVAFKTVLRQFNDNDVDALMYGAGHGGLEAAILLGLSMINNVVIAIMLNTGSLDGYLAKYDSETLVKFETVVATLTSTGAYVYLVAIVERLFAVALHLALSVIVWFGAKNNKKWYFYPLAILLHTIVDAGAVLLAQKLNVFVVEACVGVATLAVCLLAKKIWDNNAEKNYYLEK